MADETAAPDELRERAVAHWHYLTKNWHRRKVRNRIAWKLFGYCSVGLPVLVTALSATPVVPRWWILVASAAAALVAGLVNSMGWHQHWTLSRDIEHRLRTELFLFEQGAGRYGEITGDERTRLFSVRITEIGATGDTSWAVHIFQTAAAVKTADHS